MKRSLKSIIGYKIGATDGEIGKVREVYFDDKTWTIRYIIVETGSWLNERKVLISPAALLTTDWEKGILPVTLTKDQIKNSPDIDTDKPVSRQQEIELLKHYNWDSYWEGGFYGGGMPVSMYQVMLENDSKPASDEVEGDQHLRSSGNVGGYHVQATDGGIGDVEDFVIDDSSWIVQFLVIDTGHWLPGKKVLISPKWVKEINWETATVQVNASTYNVKNSPEYHPNEAITEMYELNLHDYYGRLVTH